MRPENPLHVYPIYAVDNDLSKLGFYYAPTYRSVAFQFNRAGTATVSAFDLVTIDGVALSQDISEIDTFEDASGTTHYWTQGNNLSNPPANGTKYRPRITLTGGAIFWGHMVHASSLFDVAYPSVRISACMANGGGSFDLTLDPTYATGANVQLSVSDDNSSYYAVLDPASPILDASELTSSGGSYSAIITIVAYLHGANGGTRRVSVAYQFTASLSDVCGTAALGTGVQSGLEDIDAFELTIYNTKDIQTYGLLYSQGFRQKLWFKGFFAQPQPQVTENYLANGESTLAFQSASVREAQVLEFWPCPDRAAIALPFAKYNDRIILIGAGNSYTLYQMDFEAVEVEREDRPKGRITASFNGAFIQANLSNYESA